MCLGLNVFARRTKQTLSHLLHRTPSLSFLDCIHSLSGLALSGQCFLFIASNEHLNLNVIHFLLTNVMFLSVLSKR